MKSGWERFELSSYPGDIWEDWNRLNREYNASHPMMDSRFVAKLVQFFPAKIDVLVATHENETVALVLVESGKHLITTLYRPSQIQLALAVVPGRSSSLFDQILSCMPWTVMRLDLYSLDPLYHASLMSEMEADLESGAVNMVIEIGDDFSDYWSKRPKNLRKNISRYTNRINRDFGGFHLDVITGKDAIGAAVERYASIESRGWKGKAGTALHPGNVQGDFYRDVMQDFASVGEAFIFELYLAEQLVASRLCIASKEQLIILKTTYDEEFSNYATGRILLYETIRYVFETRISSRIDFYTNATREQLEWATGSRVMYNLSMYRPSAKSLTRLVKRVKRTPQG